MLEARQRDRFCRFPRCPCRFLGIPTHTSHQRHRGMGGNPSGDRSTTDKLLLLCANRHRESPYSVDRGTLRWEGLTDKGADGPIVWFIRIGDLWYELARELEIGRLAPMDVWQERCVERLIEELRAPGLKVSERIEA